METMMVLSTVTSRVTLMGSQVVQNVVILMIAITNLVSVADVAVEDLIASHVKVVDPEVVEAKVAIAQKEQTVETIMTLMRRPRNAVAGGRKSTLMHHLRKGRSGRPTRRRSWKAKTVREGVPDPRDRNSNSRSNLTMCFPMTPMTAFRRC